MSQILAGLFASVMHFFADAFMPGANFYSALSRFLGIFGIHKTLYIIVGMFFTRHFPPAKHFHKYAICIPARNEEAVIGNLIDSIHRQDYPAELITVFVVADNCSDHTAEIAREKGAVCYEHNNTEERTKGFALKYLFERIAEDYGITAFEGYFIFDSDNLLNRDYISRMNDSFDAGEKIITSYRNTKNFDENWIASTYALHWLRSIRVRHRARSVFHLATNIQGTGFLFANELVKDGWNYTSLTEDRAFTADAVAHGYAISYNDAAMFYDEQPTSLRIALRQRLRWSKGHLQAFAETGWPLFKNIFVGNCYAREERRKQKAQRKNEQANPDFEMGTSKHELENFRGAEKTTTDKRLSTEEMETAKLMSDKEMETAKILPGKEIEPVKILSDKEIEPVKILSDKEITFCKMLPVEEIASTKIADKRFYSKSEAQGGKESGTKNENAENPADKRRRILSQFLEGIRHRVASFDTLAQLVPTSVIRLFAWIPVYIFFYGGYCYDNGIRETVLFKGGSWLARLLDALSGHAGISLPAGVLALFAGIGLSILGRAIGYIAGDIKNMILAAYVFIAERKRLVKFSLWKKILYCITFPIFDMIGRYTMYVAVFKKVTWKTIPHTSKVTIEDIEQR